MKYLLLDPKERPKNIRKKVINELIQYIQERVGKKHFPSRREIESKFRIRLDSYFKGIEDLYKKAGHKYKLHANQNIKSIKAKLLLKLIIKNLKKFNLEFVVSRGVRERGIDLLAKKGDKIIGIEIKAYNKREKLKNRDIKQVERFIKKEKLDKAIIITTTNKKDNHLKIPNNISIIDYKSLLNILEENRDLSFIRNYSINREDTSKKIKRQKILDYVYQQYNKKNLKPTYNDISNTFHLHIYSYFTNLFEIYKILQIPPPLKNMKGKHAKKPDEECIELWKNEFKRYILKEVKEKNRYPSGDKLSKYFKIGSIWNITNMTDLYEELGFKPYLKRKKKTTSAEEL